MKTILQSIILSTLFITFSFANIINVPTDQPSIQAGINAAINGDTVLVADSTYYENIIIQSKYITLASYFLIDGDTSHISKTIINGSQPVNTDYASVITVNFSADTTIICGLTITEGYGNRFPASAGNWARGGGGIYSAASNLIICDNKIIDNVIDGNTVPDPYTGASGGGIILGPLNNENLSVIIRNNIISNNYMESIMTFGAGIALFNEDAHVFNYIIENNTIKNNTCFNTDDWKAMGGGIAMTFELPTGGAQIIRNNNISNNQVICDNNLPSKHSFGGGLYIVMIERLFNGSIDNDTNPNIYNNLIIGNHSDYLGGGVSVWWAYKPDGSAHFLTSGSFGQYTPKPSFVNNTIVNNTAKDGSGFYIMNSVPFLMNNILWNQHPDSAKWGEIFLGDEPRWTQMVEPNIYGGAKIYYSDIQDTLWPGTGNINADPLFADTLLYNLSDFSKCIGWGTDSVQISSTWYYAPSIDYDGDPRPNPIDAFIDIGAQESVFIINKIKNEESYYFPKTFSLNQNYPNPFNPSTQIKYTLPKSEKVIIEVFNLLGQKIKTLLNTQMPSGSHEVEFTAKNLSSGVYLYRVEAGEYQEVRKMILLK